MNDPILKKDIANEIEVALKEKQFFLVYQPQLETSTSRLLGFEALIRWRHPKRGMIPPAVFIPLTEVGGQIVELGKWILDQACRDLRTFLIERQRDDLHIAVNLSSVQLQDPKIISDVMETLVRNQLAAKHLHIELTETALLTKIHRAESAIAELHRAGVQVWIDDFGTGYTSINMLRQYKVSGIKVDQSFVKGICNPVNDNDFCLVSALIALAQRMRLRTVAEGVASEQQLRVLQQLGCDVLQGFLIGKPQPLQDILMPEFNQRRVSLPPISRGEEFVRRHSQSA